MGKVLTSPVKRFAGTVTLLDPVPFPAFMTWRQALDRAIEARIEKHGGTPETTAESMTVGELAATPTLTSLLLPGLCAMVERWDLVGFPEHVTPDTFPATPRQASIRVVGWLVAEIDKLMVGEEEAVPN